MQVIHFQLVFCVIKSDPENVLHFNDSIQGSQKEDKWASIAWNTRWKYSTWSKNFMH